MSSYSVTIYLNNCKHRSKRPSDLQKHVDAKHPSGAAKPKGPKRRKRIAPVYRTKQGEKLMADAIKAALKPSKKRRRPVISSDESSSDCTITQFDPAYTTPEYPPILMTAG